VVLLAFYQAEVPKGSGHQTENNRKINLVNCIRSNLKGMQKLEKIINRTTSIGLGKGRSRMLISNTYWLMFEISEDKSPHFKIKQESILTDLQILQKHSDLWKISFPNP
jgi:hypothetical protein